LVKLQAYLAVLLLVAVVAAACASGTVDSPDATVATEQAPAVRPDRTPLIYGPKSPDGLQAILGTADLGLGENRFGVVLTSPTGFVTEPFASVASTYYGEEGSEGQPRQTVDAEYQPWPYGNRGMYIARLTFDRAGSWGVDIEVRGADGPARRAQIFFDVRRSPLAPAVGAAALRSRSKTLADVASVADLTTGSVQDEDLYKITIAEAVESGRPTVVVFASPAFCTNAVCGPQVEVLRALKSAHGAEANFIHVDFYDNPQEIQGDLTKARLSPIVVEWRLPSIEWTVVIDGDGTIVERFEAFATYDEVDRALKPLL
jgi:hypothetical protein